MRSQKEIFCESEGDAWFARNERSLGTKDWAVDPVVLKCSSLLGPSDVKVLEVGCGDGSRLRQLTASFGYRCAGIDPSAKAVEQARNHGIDAKQGTADSLPYEGASFGAVIFGFCLYLCDDADLFKIACEADRVLANNGWLLILDFHAATPVYRAYHHLPGIVSRKMDYKSMFAWHPSYTLASFEKVSHEDNRWTDDPNEWISLSVLRKYEKS